MMAGPDPVARLAELGYDVPPVVKPVAAYVPAVKTGQHVYVSGQLPFVDGKLLATGKCGDTISTAGQHARSAVGVAELPRNAPVEVEAIFEVA
jgi:enamine deaminase RidA (YjgF/YER057c/UK114 family)